MFLPACPSVSGPASSVSPNRKKDDTGNLTDPSVVGLAPGNMFGGARAFKDMFDEAMQGGCVEVRCVLVAGRSTRAHGASHSPRVW